MVRVPHTEAHQEMSQAMEVLLELPQPQAHIKQVETEVLLVLPLDQPLELQPLELMDHMDQHQEHQELQQVPDTEL